MHGIVFNRLTLIPIMLDRLSNISLLAFDLDGVLTNGKLLVMPDGDWVRQMDIKDGFALQLAVKSGLEVAIITGSQSAPVKERMEKLGVHHFLDNVSDKGEVLESFRMSHGLERRQMLFMGDDIPDLLAFAVAGFKACPSDACWEIRQQADYISPLNGGEGCVRDVIEKTLKIQGKWNFINQVRSI